MKFKRTFLVIVTIATLVVDFFYLISVSAVQGMASADAGLVHTLLLLTGFGAFGYLQSYFRDKNKEARPVSLLLKAVLASIGLLFFFWITNITAGKLFALDGDTIIPASMAAVISSYVIGVLSGFLGIVVFNTLSGLIFIKRTKTTKRNFQILLIVMSLNIIETYITSPNGLQLPEASHFDIPLTLLMVAAMLVNAFRFSWIVYLTRREKILSLLLTFVGMIFSSFILWLPGSTIYTQAMEYFNPALNTFVGAIALFNFIYMGIGFISTLLHLPTAKEFDRKKIEISSLQNMGKLMTQVLDYDELTSTSTQLALDMVEADYAWIELLTNPSGNGTHTIDTYIVPASLINIDETDIRQLKLDDTNALEYLPIQTGKALIVSDVRSDRRLRNRSTLSERFGSIALVPLRSHKGLIGLLGVAKQNSYEFDADMLNGLYAFADMISIAMENSKLIEQSIEKQRMEQELQVAQQMQRKLLPRNLPQSDTLEISAASVPAYEVGGDYYDILTLANGGIGFIVGDVSGKGASAALYMAQVKGIFQSLGTYFHQPGDLLRRMNSTLCRNTDKKYFVSLIYGLLHPETGVVRFSRAGHCPLLHVTKDASHYLKPKGMGLGLNNARPFDLSLEEQTIQLTPGDLVVFYTDGITEAKNSHGEEYDLERLSAIIEQNRTKNVQHIVDSVVDDVRAFKASVEPEDDMTLLILRWTGPENTGQIRSTEVITIKDSLESKV